MMQIPVEKVKDIHSAFKSCDSLAINAMLKDGGESMSNMVTTFALFSKMLQQYIGWMVRHALGSNHLSDASCAVNKT